MSAARARSDAWTGAAPALPSPTKRGRKGRGRRRCGRNAMITRRSLLEAAGTGAVLAVAGGGLSRALASQAEAQAAALNLPAQLPEGTRQQAVLDALSGKKPLIKLSYRPPNYETPIELLRGAITPDDVFFVRYHLSDIPEVNAQTWRLSIGGEGANREA